MNKIWWLASFIVIGILMGVGILLLVTRPPRGVPITLLPAPTAAPITVFVSGNVRNTGLYALPSGSRVNDVIQMAGGFTDAADREALNLAQILQDGQQINVPGILPTPEGGGITRSNPITGQLVDINRATLDELDTLPGIGPVTAQKIIDYRLANGPFITTDGLLEVDGIGQVTFDKIKDLITVGTSP